MSEIRGRKTEVGGRRPEVRGRKSEVGGQKMGLEEYPADYYREFLEYVIEKYKGQYWLF